MTTTAPSQARPGPRRMATATVTASLLTAMLAACSTGEETPAESPSSSAPPAPPLPTTTRLGAVTGTVGPLQQERAMAKVTQAVDGWMDAAYVSGDYPRETFADAFPRFTAGAAEEAAEDVLLMSNADIGQRIEGVTARVRRVTIDLLGTKGVAQAATARVRLVFDTDGSVQSRVSVDGRLRLVRQGKVWRIFGYDITKSDQPTEPSAGDSPSATEEAG